MSFKLSVAYKPFVLGVIMLSVVMLNVVALSYLLRAAGLPNEKYPYKIPIITGISVTRKWIEILPNL